MALVLGLGPGCTSRVPLTEHRALTGRVPKEEPIHQQPLGDRIVSGGKIAWHLTKSQTVSVAKRPLYSTGKLLRLAREQLGEWGERTRLTLWDFPRLWLDPVSTAGETPGFDTEVFELELDRLTGSGRHKAELSFCASGEVFFRELTADIAGAREKIWAQIYIFDNDDVAVALADLLKERSREIEVRVSFDGLGSLMAAGNSPRTLPRPTRSPVDMETYLAEDSQVEVRSLPNIWLVGDHTKLFLIDGEKAWLGGMNIGREYRHEWHDLMVSLRGPLLGKLEEEFERAWSSGDPAGEFSFLFNEDTKEAQKKPREDQTGGAEVRLLMSRPGTTEIRDAQMAAIRQARQRVWLENPYLASDAVIYELCAARRRGVDVRVILPDLCNHPLMQSSNRLAVNTLRRHGVRVFAYPGMTHVKAMVCDGWACFGTANFDKLSSQLNYELALATSDKAEVRELEEALFEPDFRASKEILGQLNTLPGDRLLELIADEL